MPKKDYEVPSRTRCASKGTALTVSSVSSFPTHDVVYVKRQSSPSRNKTVSSDLITRLPENLSLRRLASLVASVSGT